MATVFIDGQAGTTGLQITDRLTAREDIDLLYLTDDARKDAEERRRCLNECDVAILCLPDAAAVEAVELANDSARIIDASTAHRTAAGWAYGLPEMTPEHRATIADAQFVSNPGCYPQGFILMIRPLIEAGVLSPDVPLRCNAVSGYSGGGRQMIEQHADFSVAEADAFNCQAYALNLNHKHVPEMHHFSGTGQKPIFSPLVAHYYKGMLVQVPLFRTELSCAPEEIHAILTDRYAGETFIEVLPYSRTDLPDAGYLNPTACNDSNRLQIMVLGNDDQLVLTSRYDNLGKGAAGAAVQNLNLMLGLDERLSL